MRKNRDESKMTMWKNCHKKGHYFLLDTPVCFFIEKTRQKATKNMTRMLSKN